MKVILITAHSDGKKSHTYQAANQAESVIKSKGHEVIRHEAFDMPLVKPKFDETGEVILNTDYDELIDQLKSCDEVVIACPFWNWSFPWALKNVIEGIIQKDKTFVYGKKGPEGTLKNIKRVTIYWTSGGPKWFYQITNSNFLVKHLTHVFKWLGSKKVRNFGVGGIMTNKNTPTFEKHLKAIDTQW